MWDMFANFFIPQLLIVLEYQTIHQSNARTKYSHRIVKYEKNLICIFMNFNENVRNKRKIAEKIRECSYKIPPLSLTHCPSLPNLISNKCYATGLLLIGRLCRSSNLHIHTY